jgi:drug/metabolite transporter (DMT)-like permease
MSKFQFLQKEYWFVVAAGILSGAIIFGGKIFSDLGLSLYQISTLPFIIVVILLSPLFIFKKDYRPKKEHLYILFIFGLVNALLVLCEFAPVVLGVPVAVVVFLIYTQPLWTILLSVIFLKEKISWKNIIACILVLLGAAILVNPRGIESSNLVGIIVALIGGILLSAWIVIGSFASRRKVDPITTIFVGRFFMLIILAALYPLLSIFITDPKIISFSFNLSPSIWFYIIIFSVFALILNNFLCLTGFKKISASSASVIVLLEPISAALLSLIFLHQPLGWNMLFGGALILAANYLVIPGDNQNNS